MKGDYKRTTIVTVLIALSAVFWIVAGNWMHSSSRFTDWAGIGISGGLLVIVASSLALGFLILSRGYWTWVAIAGVLGAYLAVNGFQMLYLVGAALALGLWAWSVRDTSRELTDRRTIRVNSIMVHALPKILLGLYILVSFVFYMTPDSRAISEKDATDALRVQIDSAYNTVLSSELNKLPPSQREQAKAQVTGLAIQILQRALSFNVCLAPDACTPTLLQLLPPLYAFLFFTVIWSFGFIFRELAVLLGMLVFAVLRGFKVVTIEQEDAKVDVLQI